MAVLMLLAKRKGDAAAVAPEAHPRNEPGKSAHNAGTNAWKRTVSGLSARQNHDDRNARAPQPGRQQHAFISDTLDTQTAPATKTYSSSLNARASEAPPDPRFFFPTPVVAGAGSRGVPSPAPARGGTSFGAAAQTGVTSSSMVKDVTTRSLAGRKKVAGRVGGDDKRMFTGSVQESQPRPTPSSAHRVLNGYHTNQ